VLGYLAAQGQITVSGSILNPTIGSACSGTVTSGGWNLVSDVALCLAGPGDLTGTDPQLAPPATLGPGNTSDDRSLWSPRSTRDARVLRDRPGRRRPTGGRHGDGTTACDRGAIELEPVTSLTPPSTPPSTRRRHAWGPRVRDRTRASAPCAAVMEADA
jgi:hypothetical protein